MSNMFKVLSAVLFAGSLAFAQSDDLFSDDFQDAATADSIAQANAEATNQANIGNAQAVGGQWEGFKYEDMGLTQWEYQQAKEQGVSREKLTKLVELGIRPTEYLQKPWNRLGVSEEDWLSQPRLQPPPHSPQPPNRHLQSNSPRSSLKPLRPQHPHQSQQLRLLLQQPLRNIGHSS